MSAKISINKELYCQFLIASQARYSMLGLAELLNNHPAHDSFTRWLKNVKLKPHIIWEYAENLVDKNSGYLIVDDCVLDKFFGRTIEPVSIQYSGLHHTQVYGIGVVNLLWTNKKQFAEETSEHIPVDFRIFDKKRDGKTKNEHCQDMITLAMERGFKNITVLMDCAYSDLKTLKLVHRSGWKFVTGLKGNRVVSLAPHEYRSVAEIATEEGIVVHLKKFGFIKLIKLVNPKSGDIDYLATNDLSLTSPDIRKANACRWKVEEYHRGTKQTTGIENCQARLQRAQRNHIFCSSLTFLALEKHRLEKGCSWYESKQRIITDALKDYLEKPFIPLPQKALT